MVLARWINMGNGHIGAGVVDPFFPFIWLLGYMSNWVVDSCIFSFVWVLGYMGSGVNGYLFFPFYPLCVFPVGPWFCVFLLM